MARVSWRALTASRLASLKDYVAQKDYKTTYNAFSSRVRGNNEEKQTWDQWARQRLGRPADLRRMSPGVEKVQLFPGWAVRRYVDPAKVGKEGAEFSLDVYVSGFASSVRPPEAATRSQKVFYRIAKGYAALPKLPAVVASSERLPQESNMSSDFDLLSKPSPTLADITDESELVAVEAHLQNIPSSPWHISDGEGDRDEGPQGRGAHQPGPSLPEDVVDEVVHKLHANFDARLQPFWSNAIPNRLVRLSVFCPYSTNAPFEAKGSIDGQDMDTVPIAIQDVITSPQGSFQTIFNVPWERLATHPQTLHIPFGESNVEYPIVVQAELWAPPPPSPSFPTSPFPYSPHQRGSASYSQPQFSPSPNSPSFFSSSSSSQSSPPVESVKSRVTIPLSLPHVPIRLISDIDDTVKHTGILLGAKTVFQNVFVRHLDELVVHNMVDWYQMLWQRGVRFHYVSNSPFELLPVVNEFFRISSLPQGSIKLKSYAARSLLPALLSSPALRKRQGVIEVLDAFPESQFILVGDTGEQDMELYAELARDRPSQIVGVFIRDVTTTIGQYHSSPDGVRLAGTSPLSSQFDIQFVDTKLEHLSTSPREPLTRMSPSPLATPGLGGTVDPSPSTSFGESSLLSPRSPITRTASMQGLPGALPRRKTSGNMTPQEKRMYELRMRIQRAGEEIPQHIAFRVFQEPQECIEAQGILRKCSEE